MKKFIALVLSLIMTFAVASPAYAISNGYAFTMNGYGYYDG